jgi:glyoxylase-like metal-dependent hydrolase (beta-lactamase superfamily II)
VTAGDRPDEASALVAPTDPRTQWPVPPLGRIPQQARLDELVTRVLAPNPSMMSLDGTNTYVVGAAGSGVAAIVDPGPPDPAHLDRVRSVLAAADAECRWILVTHHHIDHAEAAQAWSAELGATVAAGSSDVAGLNGHLLEGGERLEVGSTYLTAVPTPGHCGDHIAFRLESGAVLVGDHILGRGTSVVTYPEGDLLAYLASLRRVLELGPSALYPGHGPEMADDPSAVIEYYLAHRRYREQQILAILAAQPASAADIVTQIYADVPRRLWPAAEQSTRAALVKLRTEGRIDVDTREVASLVI